jgi:hypothetical protein
VTKGERIDIVGEVVFGGCKDPLVGIIGLAHHGEHGARSRNSRALR